ncbi:MAG: hypothetical protein KME11_01275 [Timaviella obliquedivisa GSE-PSE-MK23-08B]|nr:hypothetical protein [Timaviella obliquedivisa GSE-PSE-MK23-08B]
MKLLTIDEFNQAVGGCVSQVFFKKDPWYSSFQPRIAVRRIIYPINAVIEGVTLNAICEAAESVGDEGCYVADLKYNRELSDYVEYAPVYLDIAEFREGYVFDYGTFMICSPSSSWGVLGSVEHHALIGGTHNFMEVFEHDSPDLETQLNEFLRYHKTYATPSALVNFLPVLKDLLSHLYSTERAKQLIKKAGFLNMLNDVLMHLYSAEKVEQWIKKEDLI